MLRVYGLDALLFLRSLRLQCYIIFFAALYCCGASHPPQTRALPIDTNQPTSANTLSPTIYTTATHAC